MGFSVKGCTALVTGANRGIGTAIVESLLKAGAVKVYAAVRHLDSAAALAEKHGERIVPVQIDLEQPNTVFHAAANASDVNLVINNAGVLKRSSPLAEEAIESLQYEMEVNVYGLMRMAQAFAPVLKANGGGAFVQLNSVASLRSFVDFATYAASKAASYSVTQALNIVLKEQGTAVLSVHPGPIATDMATEAGLMEMAEPASVVGDGIVAALAAGEFHLFPDSYSKQISETYLSFAKAVVESDGR